MVMLRHITSGMKGMTSQVMRRSQKTLMQCASYTASIEICEKGGVSEPMAHYAVGMRHIVV